MMHPITCPYCQGSGQAERLYEYRPLGELRPNNMLDHKLADQWIASDPNAPICWRTVTCPECKGDKEIVVESFPCKIF